MLVPTDKEIRALHEKYAPTREAFDLVHTHCEIVCEVAEQFLCRADPPLDEALVRAGALLHDIGVYRLYDPEVGLATGDYVRHGVLGHEILAAEGFPETLCRFCSHHTGVGLTREDVRSQDLPLPVADYLAETDEERLVMYADKFHSKSTPPAFNTAAHYSRSVRRFGADKAALFDAMRASFGEPDLSELISRHGHRVR